MAVNLVVLVGLGAYLIGGMAWSFWRSWREIEEMDDSKGSEPH